MSYEMLAELELQEEHSKKKLKFGNIELEKFYTNLEQIKKKTMKDDREARAKFNKEKNYRIMVLQKKVAD